MEALLLFALTFGTMAAAHDAALAQRRAAHVYYAPPVAERHPPVAYVPAVSPAPALGAVSGALIAAGAGAPALFGAAMGGLIGHAASLPPVIAAHPTQETPLARGSSASATAFIAGWQDFLQPSAAVTAPAQRYGVTSTAAFVDRWQGFMEPSASAQR